MEGIFHDLSHGIAIDYRKLSTGCGVALMKGNSFRDRKSKGRCAEGDRAPSAVGRYVLWDIHGGRWPFLLAAAKKQSVHATGPKAAESGVEEVARGI